MINIKDLLIYKILRTTAGWALGPFISLIRKLRDVARDHFCEKRLGIRTVGNSPVKEDVTMFKDSITYVPTPYNVIEKMLEKLQFGSRDVFVDLGCGKGRIIFSVAENKLKKVIGIEARKDLFDIASENLKNAKLKNTPVEIFNEDVANFDMRDGTVFFMYQPFGKNTQIKVIDSIKKSLAANPRTVRIVCYGGPDLDTLEGCDWLAHESRIANSQVNTWSSNKNSTHPYHAE